MIRTFSPVQRGGNMKRNFREIIAGTNGTNGTNGTKQPLLNATCATNATNATLIILKK